jgi:hypothetical protein
MFDVMKLAPRKLLGRGISRFLTKSRPVCYEIYPYLRTGYLLTVYNKQKLFDFV